MGHDVSINRSRGIWWGYGYWSSGNPAWLAKMSTWMDFLENTPLWLKKNIKVTHNHGLNESINLCQVANNWTWPTRIYGCYYHPELEFHQFKGWFRCTFPWLCRALFSRRSQHSTSEFHHRSTSANCTDHQKVRAASHLTCQKELVSCAHMQCPDHRSASTAIRIR